MKYKIHLSNENNEYSCIQSFNQMPISKKLSIEEFRIAIKEKPDQLCKKCISIYRDKN